MNAIIVYHKNLKQYSENWIKQFYDSIIHQSYVDFDIIEIDYGGDGNRIFKRSEYESIRLDNHAEAMNYLFDKAKDYDYVFNTNVDDYYHYNRIEKQLEYLHSGYDIVSSNFSLINEKDEIYHVHQFHNMNIKSELDKNHNILCHPVIAYSKKFIQKEKYIPSEIKFEDMKLWQRTIDRYKYIIIPDVLCIHRVHTNSIGNR